MLFLVVLVIGLPAIALCTLSFRTIVLQFAVKDACRAAAREGSWTQAQQMADLTFRRDIARFSGINAVVTPEIVIRNMQSHTEETTTDRLPIGTLDSNDNIYLVAASAKSQLSPLFPGESWLGLKIPGLNESFSVLAREEIIFENAEALTK